MTATARPHLPHTESWYAASANQQLDFPSLDENVRTDVCIVGGGYTGLSCAIHLRQLGYQVTLLEANRVGWGASGRNGGHVSTGQRADQLELEKWVGQSQARQLWDLSLEAVDTVCGLIDSFNINCELKSGNLDLAAKPQEVSAMQRYVEHLREHYQCQHLQYIEPKELATMTSARSYHGGILDNSARHLHPLNYALGLAAAAKALGVDIYEGSRVLSYQDKRGVTVATDRGQVEASYLVLACNGYLENLAPAAARYIMPINNFMLATEPLPDGLARQLSRDDVSLSDTLFVVNYWKLSADNRLLFGGGESYRQRFPSDIKSLVRKRMLKVYPELAATRIDYGWGGTLAITRNRMPDFGRLSANTFYAQGYSGHGVSIATLAGKLLSEVVSGSAERFDVMASVPSHAFPGGTLLRWPALVAGMLFYSLRDRLG